MRSDIAALRDDMREVKSRLTSLETAVSGMRREGADLCADIVGQHSRYDRLLERIERIEKRLELTPL
jgi:tetrahydromethanopterin S-methyltransferase subunit G